MWPQSFLHIGNSLKKVRNINEPLITENTTIKLDDTNWNKKARPQYSPSKIRPLNIKNNKLYNLNYREERDLMILDNELLSSKDQEKNNIKELTPHERRRRDLFG